MNLSSIELGRFVLHPLRVSDATEMVGVLADATLYEYTGGDPPTLVALEARYRAQIAGSDTPSEIWCNWIIRLATDGRPVGRPVGRAVGFVQATVVEHVADIAWTVGVDDQRRGVATAAAKGVCDWLADEGVRRVEAHIHRHHVASQTVAARIGLVRTGAVDDDGEEIWAVSDGDDDFSVDPDSTHPIRADRRLSTGLDIACELDSDPQ